MTDSAVFPVYSIEDNCVGCNRCIRVCPIETANIAYVDPAGNVKVRVDPDQCTLCAACVGICKHDARRARDDIGRFFEDLHNGAEISVIAAPSIRTNIPRWKRLFYWLRGLGVRFIYDASLGADICIWAHLRHMEKNTAPLITQPCPVIVSYCEKHKNELLKYLSPVHSPMACAAVYMRQRGVSGAIASISPCIAKTQEHAATGLWQYNITFSSLLKYMEENIIQLPEGESGFDHADAGLGALFPLPGGLTENIEFFMGKTVRCAKSEGGEVFGYLDQYAATEDEHKPDIFDVLNCKDGCLIGTGSDKNQNIFKIVSSLEEIRSDAAVKMESSSSRLSEFDKSLRLEDYLRVYGKNPKRYPEVSGEEIDRAFLQMHKDDFVSRNFNCGACGSNSCELMARKIALGLNVPSNCVILARDEAKSERGRNAEYLTLVRNIGDNLFSTQETFSDEEIIEAMKLLSETVSCSAVALWRRTGDDGSLCCDRIFGWYGSNPEHIALNDHWPEEWIARLKNGERLDIDAFGERPDLFTRRVRRLFVVPIHLRKQFWGFVDAVGESGREFTDEDASVLEAVGILLISGILEREMNKNLMDARETALEGTRAKSDFLSRMSHEMRTPMNAIIGMTRIGKTSESIEQKDACLDKISGASNHLLGVINDILDMSKIEANKFELFYEDFDFKQMLDKVINVIGFKVEDKRQSFIVNVDGLIPKVLSGDDQRLAQVITNLLSNAVKFTPEGGEIRLEAKLLSWEGEDITLNIGVADSGIGIAREQIERLFKSFEQAESGTSRKYGGTGLGLAISKRIVELMGGEIRVESAPGKGSSFSFTARLRQAQNNAEHDETEHETILDGCFEGYRVLLAEDVEINKEILFGILESTSIEIDWARNGRLAVEMFRRAPGSYDLILMDLQMPEMDGYEATGQIRAIDIPEAAAIPIIAMTANVFREDVERSIAAGMNDHIGKPIDYNELISKLRKYLPGEGQ